MPHGGRAHVVLFPSDEPDLPLLDGAPDSATALTDVHRYFIPAVQYVLKTFLRNSPPLSPPPPDVDETTKREGRVGRTADCFPTGTAALQVPIGRRGFGCIMEGF